MIIMGKKVSIKNISIIILLIAVIFLFLFIQAQKSYASVIYLNWSIKLPKPYKEIYSVESGASFHGDGQRYHVFEYKNTNVIENKLNWTDTKNPDIESKIDKILNSLNVANTNRPDFHKKYKYFIKTKEDFSKIYIIYIDEIAKLYIIEDIY